MGGGGGGGGGLRRGGGESSLHPPLPGTSLISVTTGMEGSGSKQREGGGGRWRGGGKRE